MKATIDGITYEGTPDEIRQIVENPPHRGYPGVRVIQIDPNWPHRNWDGSPRVTCCAESEANNDTH